MWQAVRWALVVVLACEAPVLAQSDLEWDRQWPQWRGPRANGIAPHANPPLEWGPEKNIAWKVAIPGQGSGTPIVWGDRIYLTTAIETDVAAPSPPEADPSARTEPPANEYQFRVMCLNRADGSVVWDELAIQEVPHEGMHATNSYASPSPTTDGERLYVSFGSRGIYCYSLEGELLWSRDLGDMRTRSGFGEAISPVAHESSVIINWDHEDESFLAVLDAETGDIRWREDRDEPSSWATPLVVQRDGVTQVITNATNLVRSYDLASGEIIWTCGGQTVNTIPSPVVVGDTVYCASGYRGSALYAIDVDAEGDAASSGAVKWSIDRGTPYVPSILVSNGRVYFTQQNTGVLRCVDAEDGSDIFGPVRLPEISSLYASPIVADGRIYYASRDGVTAIIRDADQFDVLAVNDLGETFNASPVAVDDQLFLRGVEHLYCIEEETP